MKRSYQQRTLSELALFCSLMIILSTSCVNEEYNLDKEIDLTVSVLKDISLPVGSLQKVSLSELLGLPDDTSVIASDNSGNLHFTLSDDQNILSQSITVPYFDFNDSYRGKVVERYLGSFLFSYNESYADYINLNDISTPRAFPDIPVEIEFEETDIPAQVKDIRYADVNATSSISLNVILDREIPIRAYVAAGTSIVYPDWVVLGNVGIGMKKTGQVVELLDDVEISVSTPSNTKSPTVINIPVVGVDATKLPEGQAFTPSHTFLMKDQMTISGSSFFTFDGSAEVTGGLVSPIISSMVSFSDLDINSVEIKLGDDIEKDLVSGLSPIVPKGIPDILSSPDIVLDLCDVRLDVEFNNSSPFSGNISTVVKTSLLGQPINDSELGPVHFESGSAEGPAEMRWSFSEGLLEAPEGYTLYKVDDISDLVRNIPDLISFNEFNLKLDDEFFTVCPGDRYDLSQKFSIHAPLAFGQDFRFPYSYEITELGFEFTEVQLSSAVLKMEVENTIPVSFGADAYALDENGELIEGLTLEIKDDARIEAGSIDSPTVSEIVFVLTNTHEEIILDGVVINFIASAPDSRFEGVPLNENQSLHFRNIVLSLPEGVSANINEL